MDGENRQRSRIGYEMRHKTRLGRKGKRSLALSLSRLQWDRGSRERERDSDIFGAEHPLDGDALSLFRSTQSLLSCAQERELSLKKSLAEAWMLSSRRPGRSRAGKGGLLSFSSSSSSRRKPGAALFSRFLLAALMTRIKGEKRKAPLSLSASRSSLSLGCGLSGDFLETFFPGGAVTRTK